MKKIIYWSLALFLFGLTLFWLVDLPLSSPLGDSPFSRFLTKFPHSFQPKIVYGFLPYWNLDTVVLQPELTHLAYFALSVGSDGNLLTQANGGTEPGYRQMQSENFLNLSNTARNNSDRLIVVLSQFNNETIAAFLGSTEAQTTFLREIDSLLLAYPFTGLNLDFEYVGDAPQTLRSQFTQFVSLVRNHLNDTYQNIELTVDMYPAAASKNQLWEVEKISPVVDYIVVMAYDFHRSSSPTAGPVAPLLQGNGDWHENINAYLKDFTKKASPEKLLLGIPFYGYEWQTTSNDPAAFTIPSTGATASYQRVQSLIAQADELQLTERWDDNALVPYLSYTRDNEPYLLYYENARSLAYKLEYVKQLNLAGIAIWSLGYEGNSRDLWSVINTQLGSQN